MNAFTRGQGLRVRDQIGLYRRLGVKQGSRPGEGSQGSGKHHHRRLGPKRGVY